MYLENRILNRNELIIQLNIKTSEAIYPKGYMENNTTNFVNNPDQKMQRYASGDEKATRASPSGHFQIYLVKLIRAQGGCLGTKSR